MKKNSSLKFKKLFLTNGVLIIYVFIAILAPVIANQKPLFISINGKKYFPALSDNPYIDLPVNDSTLKKTRTNNIDWQNIKADNILFAPVRWSPTTSDLINNYVSPFDEQYKISDGNKIKLATASRHFLGTGNTGIDLLSGLIHGARTSIIIGFFSMSIAVVLGILLGGLAGYLGDHTFKIRKGSLFLAILFIIPAWFYAFYLQTDSLKNAFENSFILGTIHFILNCIYFTAIISLPLLIRFGSINFLNKKINIPVDSIISRMIEIFLSLPRLILILTIAAISKPAVSTIIIIIGITSWTEIARLIRVQFLQLREMNYISAAKASGIKTPSIIFKHLLPNAMSQVLVIWVFGIAAAILVETGLSFLGIGVPAGTATWGSLMFQAKENFQAWWLVIFTGLFVFILLSSLYNLGNRIKKSATY
jgi:peptide/nickel transport system permease protein